MLLYCLVVVYRQQPVCAVARSMQLAVLVFLAVAGAPAAGQTRRLAVSDVRRIAGDEDA